MALRVSRRVFVGGALATVAAPSRVSGFQATPHFVATYTSIGIRLTSTAAPINTDGCRVQFKQSDAAAWRDGMNLWWDRRFGEYRGSVVLLSPGSTFDFRFTHDDGSVLTIRNAASTWPDVSQLRVARTIDLPANSTATLVVSQGGTPDGWLLYRGGTIDVGKSADFCVQLDSRRGPIRNVIFSGVRFKGAARHCVLLGSTPAESDEVIEDVIFDQCEFTDWGRPPPDARPDYRFGENFNSGLFSKSRGLRRVTVQGCFAHNPTFGANSWFEFNSHGSFHPEGPQFISFIGSPGNHVIRYNTIQGSELRCWNDTMGEYHNFSDAGFPCADTDIYRNVVMHSWDDGLEMEGRDENIRVYQNFFDCCFDAISFASCYRGPAYVFQNVGRHSRTGKDPKNANGQSFIKVRRWGSDGKDWSGGRVYLINNTTLPPSGMNAVFGFPNHSFRALVHEHSPTDGINNFVVWNNVVNTDGTNPSIGDPSGTTNHFDYNLLNNRPVYNSVGPRQGAHDIIGSARYVSGWGMDDRTLVGEFRLASNSPGYACGKPIANIFEGIKAPDMGAHQHGSPPMAFGHMNLPVAMHAPLTGSDDSINPELPVGEALAGT